MKPNLPQLARDEETAIPPVVTHNTQKTQVFMFWGPLTPLKATLNNFGCFLTL